VPKKTDAADVAKRAALKKELLSSKIDLGRDKNAYDTTYNTEHNTKGYCMDHGKSLEIMKDLRNTHYQLGYQKVSLFKSAFWHIDIHGRVL
jgi:hypothetical protein